ncbi:60S ribosomal export protein NMD3 [Cimex lectularius]|uniref:60S ribosomal export protein NMD3 n=1 Tax=Cimex lectularius TaxID=79782 RepID=A0A8I6REV5_CIMLE|nr:60S ribosomal export protein NMD3 [Cimex lectularius]
MEYVSVTPNLEVGDILCCQCGVPIKANPANMCVHCVRTQVDITAGIPKQATIHFCRGCERYFQPPSEWIHAELESRELLGLCLKKLKGLNRVKLVDAGFVWTEPHSKRLKVKLTVQGEVFSGAVLQQIFIVEFTVANQMCDDCHRTEAQNFWRASVQVRQRAENKKTFYYLEQLILKHKAHDNTLGIKPIHEGIDFFFATESHAKKMVDFLSTVLPIKWQHSKKLLSHDIHSNVYNYKFTFSVEIVPISKDSIVCLSTKMASHFGGISQVCIVQRVSNNIHLIDPSSSQIAEVTGTNYWRDPFKSIFNPKQLSQYIVMDIEPIADSERKLFPGQGHISIKHVLCDVWLVKESDLGMTESTIHTRSHLGHILKPGDTVLGYNLNESNVNDDNFDKVDKDKIPDVIIVKKHYPNRSKRRMWKLKHLPRDDTSINSADQDYAGFLDDLEEDAVYRQNVNIYKDPKKAVMPVDTDDVDESNQFCITLEEMLDDLHVDDVEMAE